jgi:hypothetical protein
MGIYYVRTIVEYGGEVEADTAEEAEKMGWNWDTELHYHGVEYIDVEVVEEDDDEDEAL